MDITLETKITARQTGQKLALDVGCGRRKQPGAIGLDFFPLPGVDVVADLEKGALPFGDNSFDKIYAYHVLEHMVKLSDILAELHRIAKPGALIEVVVPYFSCVGAFGDPTHVRFFTYRTLEHFTDSRDDGERHTWFSAVRFSIRHRWLGFGKAFRLLGIEWFANRLPNIYENFLPYIFPARTLTVELVVLKDS